MSSKKQTVLVQVLAFFTAALSVIFLRQYAQGRNQQKFQPSDAATLQLPPSPKILLETAEVLLTEDIVVTPIEN